MSAAEFTTSLAFRRKEGSCVYKRETFPPIVTFFPDLFSFPETDRLILMREDFNCVCSLDQKFPLCYYTDRRSRLLDEIMEVSALTDIGKLLLSAWQLKFTHFQGSYHAHLDRSADTEVYRYRYRYRYKYRYRSADFFTERGKAIHSYSNLFLGPLFCKCRNCGRGEIKASI